MGAGLPDARNHARGKLPDAVLLARGFGPWPCPAFPGWIRSGELVDASVQDVGPEVCPVGELVEGGGGKIQEDDQGRGLLGGRGLGLGEVPDLE